MLRLGNGFGLFLVKLLLDVETLPRQVEVQTGHYMLMTG
jgi:hypothetical protein